MSRAKAEAAKAKDVSVISKAELDRIKNITKITTKEEQEMQRTVFQEQKNQSMAASKARRQRIMDNDFNSIYSSIQWGRAIFDNVKKFLQF